MLASVKDIHEFRIEKPDELIYSNSSLIHNSQKKGNKTEIENLDKNQINNICSQIREANQIRKHRNYDYITKIQEVNYKLQKNAQKQEFIREEREANLFKECTFQPNIDKPISARRSNNQFYKDQQFFVERKKFNLQRLQEDQCAKEEKSIYEKPEIGQLSIDLSLNKMKSNNNNEKKISEKLYHLKTESFQNFIKSNEFSEKNINKSRRLQKRKLISNSKVERFINDEKSISILLYKDALRRQQELKDKEDRMQNQIIEIKTSNPILAKFLINKLEREMNSAFLRSQINGNLIEFEQFRLILYMMGFIIESSCDDYQEKDINDLWKFIGGETNQLISKAMLLKVFKAIMNIFPKEILENETRSQKHITPNYKGITKSAISENTTLSLYDISEIHHKFHRLYLNKMSFNGLSFESKQTNYSFKPTINDNSILLANEARKKLINETIEEVNLVNNFNLNSTIVDEKAIIADNLVYSNKKKIDLILKTKQEKEAKAFQECTFKPSISEYKPYPFCLKTKKKETQTKPSTSFSKISKIVKNVEGNSLSNREGKILQKEFLRYLKIYQNKELLTKRNTQKLKTQKEEKPKKFLQKKQNLYMSKLKKYNKSMLGNSLFTKDKEIERNIQEKKGINKEDASIIINENKEETQIKSQTEDKLIKAIRYKCEVLPSANQKGLSLVKAQSSKIRNLKIGVTDSHINTNVEPLTGKYDNQIPHDLPDSPNCRIFENTIPKDKNEFKLEFKDGNEFNNIKNQKEINVLVEPESGILSEEKKNKKKEYGQGEISNQYNNMQDNNNDNANVNSERFISKHDEAKVLINTKEEVSPLNKLPEDELVELIDETNQNPNPSKNTDNLLSKNMLLNENDSGQNDLVPTNNSKKEIIEINNTDEDICKEENSSEEMKANEDILLFININLEENNTKRICFYQNDSAKQVAEKFVNENSLNSSIIPILTEMIEENVSKILTKEEKILRMKENKQL